MGNGVNDSEKYLKALCDRTFLSLWSYTNVYRQVGSELCDLLVVVGDEIVIFSDKHCAYGAAADQELNWKRWFSKAVLASAKQLWGAESWIKRSPDRLYLDAKCTVNFPLQITLGPNTRFHLVLVAHGSSEACKAAIGGSGSHIIFTKLRTAQDHSRPFCIGDISGNKTFLHVLDDISLELLLTNLDTITDFVGYLVKREKLLRSEFLTMALGEEELLADYLSFLNEQEEHDFDYPAQTHSGVIRMFDEGAWEDFQQNPRRRNQLQADKISKFWDNLIEEFSRHAWHGTQQYVSEGGFTDAERAIRLMAQETRFARRYLSNAIIDMFSKVPKNMRMLRFLQPGRNKNVIYVFGLFPHFDAERDSSYDEYRESRRFFMSSACQVATLEFTEAKYIIGIGMESGYDLSNRSEDLIVLDCNDWNDDFKKEALRLQQELRILVKPTKYDFNDTEYPHE
ncbi:hypothetical protein ACWKW6_31725 [Dyadobacter jiangsuensis]